MTEAETTFSRRTFLVVGIVVVTALVLTAIWAASGVWLLAFAGILFSLLLQGVSGRMRSWTGLPYALVLAAVCLAFPILLGLFAALVGPRVSRQILQLEEELPRAIGGLYDRARNLVGEKTLQSQLPEPQQVIDTLLQSIGQVAGAFSTALGALLSVAVIAFIAVYLAINPQLYVKAVISFFPPEKRTRVADVLHSLARALGWWLAGRFASMAIVGVLTAVGLWLMGIPLAFSLGLLAAVLSFVPNIGPVISAVPALLLGLMEGPLTGLYVVLLYGGIQSVESYVITPMIQKKAVSIPPALLIIVQLFFGVIAGIPGLFLATPLTVCIIVLIQTFYIEDTLGENVKVLGES